MKGVKKHNYQHDAKVATAVAKRGGKILKVVAPFAGKYSEQLNMAGDALENTSRGGKALVRSKLLKPKRRHK